MNDKNDNQYNLIDLKFKIIKKELFEEWKNKFPSYSILEKSASDIIDILKKSNIEDNEFENWKFSTKIGLNIFIADLVGELEHDYEKRLDRYYKKWSKEKSKIDTYISEFRMKFGNKIE